MLARVIVLLGFLAAALCAPAADAAQDAAAEKSKSPPLVDDMLGAPRTYVTAHEDTLLDIARQNGLGFTDIVAANQGVDPWIPGEGTKIVLPTGHLLPDVPREGLVINLGEHRIYYFAEPGSAPRTWPIGVGREGWGTPLGTTRVIRKQAGPTWYPPASIRAEHPDLPKVVRPGPDNPLGSHALYFGWPGYLVHGTNQPWGVGRRVSHGCIRLYPEDIPQLFGAVPVGTNVAVLNRPVKVGWYQGELYVEAHPDPEQVDFLEGEGTIRDSNRSLADIYYRIRQRAGGAVDRLDWKMIRTVLKERRGVPTRITRPATG